LTQEAGEQKTTKCACFLLKWKNRVCLVPGDVPEGSRINMPEYPWGGWNLVIFLRVICKQINVAKHPGAISQRSPNLYWSKSDKRQNWQRLA
jgi:hypothetical protein